MEKIEKWFQVAAAALFVFFAIFNLIRGLVAQSHFVYGLCFAAMTLLSLYLLKLTWRELKAVDGAEGKEGQV